MPNAGDASKAEREKRASGGRAVRPEDALRASVQLVTELVGGTASAVADGFQALDDEISDENVRDRGLFNGLVEGLIAGQTRFLRSLAESGDRLQETFHDLEGKPREVRATEPIDYDRLAKAVAAELRQAGVTTPAS